MLARLFRPPGLNGIVVACRDQLVQPAPCAARSGLHLNGGTSPPAAAAACCRKLASAAGQCGMVGGQMADLQAEHAGVASLEHLEAIHHRKTGRLLSVALSLGGVVAEASAEQLRALRKYGECFGLAFQITDDLLDVVGDRVKMGKAVRKDSEHGKLTYPSLIGESESRIKARELIEEACSSLEPFGENGHRLESLARFILERDH